LTIYTAIDLRDGKCVRLFQGDYAQETVYADDPSEVARRFEAEGAQALHIVDLDGARSGEPANLTVVGEIIEAVRIPIQFGGGIRTLETARAALGKGVKRVVIGSRLIDSPDFAEAIFSFLGESAVAGIDAREGLVAVSGWTEISAIPAEILATRMENLGARRFIVTDIARDGALQGPNLEFFKKMSQAVKGKVIASGGVSGLNDIGAIHELGCPNIEGIIVGRALYEGRFNLTDALQLLAAA
jgi:phosphoribosylformimino-5-aminoimidazole carboxamide ribotide isomerase